MVEVLEGARARGKVIPRPGDGLGDRDKVLHASRVPIADELRSIGYDYL